MRPSPRLALAALLVAVLALPAVAQPKKDGEVPRVLAGWEALQGRVTTAEYEVSGTFELIARLGGGPMPPPAERVRGVRYRVVMDFARGRYRDEDTEDQFLNGQPRVVATISAFDGREWRSAWDRRNGPKPAERPDLMIDRDFTPDRPAEPDGPDSPIAPLFWAHGFVRTERTPFYGRRPHRHDPEDFAPGVRHQRLGGRALVVVQTEPGETMGRSLNEYWTDPGRGGVVVRQVHRYADSGPLVQTDVTLRETPAGWFPAAWKRVESTPDGRTHTIRTYRVDRFAHDPPVADGEFTIPAEPGMGRVEVTEKGSKVPGAVILPARVYRITDLGVWVEVGQEAGRTFGGDPVAVPGVWRWWHYAAAALGAVVVVVLYRAWRRRRSPA